VITITETVGGSSGRGSRAGPCERRSITGGHDSGHPVASGPEVWRTGRGNVTVVQVRPRWTRTPLAWNGGRRHHLVSAHPGWLDSGSVGARREEGAGLAGSVGSGFASRTFAASFAHEGEPLELRESGSWLIRRPIPGTDLADAVAVYPLLTCRDWSCLADDLAGLDPDDVVSVSAVVDPLADVDAATLNGAFTDLLRPYKEHLVVDLDDYDVARLPSHHRRNVHRGRRRCEVEACRPGEHADDLVALYEDLVARHGITGRAALPRAALVAQLDAPGTTLFRAKVDGAVVGVHVWVQSGTTAYYYLGATNEAGRDARAAYALLDHCLAHYRARATVAHLGAGAGVDGAGADDGLVRFKRGWATRTRTAFLGGRIVDHPSYRRLAAEGPATTYFPAHRAPRDGGGPGPGQEASRRAG
jgi:hypothetical protein